jgi:hypothetical protein
VPSFNDVPTARSLPTLVEGVLTKICLWSHCSVRLVFPLCASPALLVPLPSPPAYWTVSGSLFLSRGVGDIDPLLTKRRLLFLDRSGDWNTLGHGFFFLPLMQIYFAPLGFNGKDFVGEIPVPSLGAVVSRPAARWVPASRPWNHTEEPVHATGREPPGRALWHGTILHPNAGGIALRLDGDTTPPAGPVRGSHTAS